MNKVFNMNILRGIFLDLCNYDMKGLQNISNFKEFLNFAQKVTTGQKQQLQYYDSSKLLEGLEIKGNKPETVLGLQVRFRELDIF